jgi:hypothetical protein
VVALLLLGGHGGGGMHVGEWSGVCG